MRRLFWIVMALSLAGLGSASAFDIGPALGAKVPILAVTDEAGAPRSLADVSGPNGAILVFYRSAKWCPYCQAQLISLRDATEPLAKRGYRIAAISYDPPDVLTAFRKRRDINFALLSDVGSKTIDAFALRDPAYPEGHMAFGVPRPSIFVVGPNGIVRAKLAEEGYKTRPTNEAVLEAVDRLGS